MYFISHPISTLNHLAARLVTDQIVFFLSIVFFVVLALNYKKPFFQVLDLNVSKWAFDSKGVGFFKKHANDFAIFGNALFHILLCLIFCIIFFIVKQKFSIVLSILFVLIFPWGFNRFMKLIFKRERPARQDSGLSIQKRTSYCFPSGHVMASIPIYFFIGMLLQSFISFLPWFLIALFISICVVISRIYLSHHYFTDVLGGIFMGIFCLNISIWFYFLVGLV